MKRLFLIIISVSSASAVFAQTRGGNDTTKKTVVVTSAYKPVLKPAAKINFSASVPTADTAKPTLVYNVPAQNLFFSYQPAALKPLALSLDSVQQWSNSNFIKLGYGNYNTPFAQAGLSFGDGKSSLVNVHAKHISQKGSLPFQQYANTNADITGYYSTDKNVEWRGKLGVDRSTQYYYGYQPDTLVYTKDSLRQRYNTIGAMIGVRNKEVNAFGINYNPSISFDLFSDNRKGKETNIVFAAPLTKTFNESIAFNVGFTADMTSYRRFNGEKIKNNLYFINPTVTLKKETFSLDAGITPSWDNNAFHLLPNITATVKVKDKPFVLQGGWVGYYNKNTYQSLSRFNPWIAQPDTLVNTRITETFAGFKGSVGSHFTYNARLGVLRFTNAALFINDLDDGKTFLTVYEPAMRALRIHGEAGYTFQERFSFLAGATINKYTNLKENDKAYGLLPVELTGALRWQVLKDLQFKSDLFFWKGSQFKTKTDANNLKSAYDLNAGVEFTVMPKFNIWLQFNNILNNKYQRWNQYTVLGFNAMGGFVYSF